MSSRLLSLAFVFLVPWHCSLGQSQADSASAQVQPRQEEEAGEAKAYARQPREIAFQNDSQWQDNRWQKTDVGPVLSATIDTTKGLTLKGLAIRVGEKGAATVCFDTARLRYSAAWTEGFLEFDPRRFGLIRHPRAAGPQFFATSRQAGWAYQGRFELKPHEITDLTVEEGYTGKGTSVTQMPDSWGRYRGYYMHGNRVVLSYRVGSTGVLESPWYVEHETLRGFTRSFEVEPREEVLQVKLASPDKHVMLVGETPQVAIDRQHAVATISPSSEPTRFQVLITADAADHLPAPLEEIVGSPAPLSQWISEDRGRFPEVLVTQGETSDADAAYVIDTLTLPFENPWNALFFTAGHDFFSNGSAAICTVHGDVWTVSGIDRELNQLRWRRFATGLSQPLGLKIVDDLVLVVGRTQITRLHDRNGDGEADFYEAFNNDAFVSPRSHDYSACLETGPDGNFYFIHAKTGVMRVSPDGETMTSIADGFRNPNGLGVGPDGTITAAPQQGQWTPESSLIVVKPGGYYGYGGPRVSDARPEGWDLPMCFIPRAMDNSGGGQVWVTSDRWGPLQGQMIHFSYGQCQMLLALRERSGEVDQGGTIVIPTSPADFQSGSMRGRFHPLDGQLYVSGLRGWQTRAIRDGCFQRVRYTGKPVHLPVDVQTLTNGIQLTFSEPLEPEVASDPDYYFASEWNYRWSSEYGSPDFSVENPEEQGRDEVPILSATLLDDDRSVFLEMPARHPVHQLLIEYELVSRGGERFRGRYAHTINAEPTSTFSKDRIQTPPEKPPVLANPRRGVLHQFDGDVRLARMFALHQHTNDSATPFLSSGPFSVTMSGAIRVPLSGFFQFRVDGSGTSELRINDVPVDLGSSSSQTPRSMQGTTVRLVKGDNSVRLRYASPAQGDAQMRLMWRGYDFGWEPVPPSMLFHEGDAPELARATERRQTRLLFAEMRCAQCHQTDLGQSPMHEITLASPDLRRAGNRFRQRWLAQWLRSPHQLDPETRMPNLLGRSNDAERTAADLAAFLTSHDASVASDPTESSSSGETDAVDESLHQRGLQSFETLGCISCHHFQPPNVDDPFDRHSLHLAHLKYKPGALRAFLLDPDRHDRSTEMPDFGLSDQEAVALAAYIRASGQQQWDVGMPAGDAERGRELFASVGCRQCHARGESQPVNSANRMWPDQISLAGCLAIDPGEQGSAPDFHLSDDQCRNLQTFISRDLKSLTRTDPSETAARLLDRLQCVRCHDLDGQTSPRPLIVASEGSGRLPELLPSLSRVGEKFRPDWTENLLAGRLSEKSRPWLEARMPAFPSHASVLSRGLAAQHGVDPARQGPRDYDPELAKIGETLTLETGLDCRQCHAIGELQPRGDEKTKIALGINFDIIGQRLRHEAYHRFMLDPTRFDTNTRMIKLSEDGLTTKLQAVYDGDARQQFEAIWHYILSL